LPFFPTGVASCRRSLEQWTSADYQAKINWQKQEISDRDLITEKVWVESLPLVYFNAINMFKELTSGWKQEIDNRTKPFGPTIEEVD
jgi:hypothetical protein